MIDLRLRTVFAACARAAMIGLMLPTVAAAAAAREFSSDPVAGLAAQLVELSPAVRRDEAIRAAVAAHETSLRLRREYRVTGPAHFHNFLVNAGMRKRGLCHHWARDLGGRLAALKLRTLALRWGIARAGTLREHNAVVVTAPGQAFERGIVLDGWRNSGRLFFAPVATDKYPWREDPHDSFGGHGRATAAR